jgi:hypothetical protein
VYSTRRLIESGCTRDRQAGVTTAKGAPLMIRITVRSQTDEPEVDVGVLTGSGSKRAKLIERLRTAGYVGLVKDEPDDLAIASAISRLLINVMAEPDHYRPVLKPQRRTAA